MKWFRDHPRYSVMLGLTALLPLCLVLYLCATLLGLRAGYQEEVDRLEPRIARLQGLMVYEADLERAAGEVGSDVLDLVYPASQDTGAVSAALQKNLREILSGAGLGITNSQIVPVREGDNFDRIAVKLTVTGNLEGLDAALAEITTYQPLLLVEELDVWPVRDRRVEGSEQTITSTVQVLALRARS